jgi:hypothetical protein
MSSSNPARLAPKSGPAFKIAALDVVTAVCAGAGEVLGDVKVQHALRRAWVGNWEARAACEAGGGGSGGGSGM